MELLAIIQDHLRRGFAHFKLGAHLLQTRCKRFDLLLLFREFRLKLLLHLRDRRFLLLHLAVFFEKLVEQHRDFASQKSKLFDARCGFPCV